MKSIISVEKIVENTCLCSRDIINHLRKAILKTDTKSVDLDFKNIEFISRSAAHELLLLKEELKRKILKKKEISFINTNKSINDLLRIIAANRALPKNKKPKFKAEKISIKSIL